MKKLLLCALFALGVFGVAGCATSEKTTATNEKTTTNSNAKKLSDNPLYKDCVKNENKNSCQRLIDSGVMASIEQCDKENCNDIGLVYFRIQNYQQALKYFKKACELNNAFGCGNLANFYYRGLGVKQNFYEAFKLFKKACDLNLSGACYNLAVVYQNGKGVKQDFVNARKYYEKACDANDAWACNNLGVLYYDGQGIKQNSSTAKKYYGKGCDLGNQVGCDNYRILNEQGVK